MKIIDGSLFLEFSEMVESGVTVTYLKKAKWAGYKCWDFITDPDDKRKVLIGYDNLKDTYQQMVTARYGNPYDAIARQPILQMVTADPKAYDFFFSYQYELNNTPNRLTIQQVAQCTRSAAWLALVGKVLDKKTGWREIKEAIGIKQIPEFFTHASSLIQLEIANGQSTTYGNGPRQLPGNFPFSYQRLKERAAAFLDQGPEYCLPRSLGNKIAAKLGKTEDGYDPERYREQIAVIRKVAAMPNNFNAAQVAGYVKPLFEANRWEMVSEARIWQIMQENGALLTPGRRGAKEYRNNVGMQVKRTAPQWPTAYYTLDGWTAELAFREGSEYHHRLVVVVVLDPCTKYPIGYAIGPQENAELNRLACRSAVLHAREIFGDYYRPQQLQSDNYASKQLTPFYSALANLYTPAAVGNAKAKVIEPYFNYLNKTYCQTQPNWTGVNLTSRKESQPNRELLYLNRHSIPNMEGVIEQIDAMMATERAKKIAAYLELWQQMPQDLKIRMEYMGAEWLEVFGREVGDTNRLTGEGIRKVIAGRTFYFDSFDPIFRQNNNLAWQLRLDPEDMSRALAVSPDGKLRILLQERMEMPMDIRGQEAHHHAMRARIAAFNKDDEQRILDTYAEDDAITRRIIHGMPELTNDQEAILKLMPVYAGQQKDHIQAAKGLKQIERKEQKVAAKEEQQEARAWDLQREEYLNTKTDFSQYFNTNND